MRDRDWQWILSAITIMGAMIVGNGFWLLVLFLIWGSTQEK